MKYIWHKFDGNVALNLYEPLVKGMCDLIHWVIEPYYSSISPSKVFLMPRSSVIQFPVGDLTPALDLQESLTKTIEILQLLGIYVCRDGLLISKLCRILAGCEDKEQVMDVMKRYIVPGITIGNSGILSAVWKLLKDMTYDKRFEIYRYWKSISWDGLSLVHQGQTVTRLCRSKIPDPGSSESQTKMLERSQGLY